VLSDRRRIRAGLTDEVVFPVSSVLAVRLGLRWLPVPAEVIVLAVHWYLRYGLSYRDVEELLVERAVCRSITTPSALLH
jgi:hypothetical protein